MTDIKSIHISDLSVSFAGRRVFGNISADISKGEKILITGPSGSGKSTLLKCMMGFIPHWKGRITYNDTPLNSKNVWNIRTRAAYVPQEPLFYHTTVLEQIKTPFSFKANSQELTFSERDLDRLLERFLLPESIKSANTEDLSGGEKQRIAIISALMLKRDVLLLDEPTSALDAASREILADFLTNMPKTTVLIVSHDAGIDKVADTRLDITAGIWKGA